MKAVFETFKILDDLAANVPADEHSVRELTRAYISACYLALDRPGDQNKVDAAWAALYAAITETGFIENRKYSTAPTTTMIVEMRQELVTALHILNNLLAANGVANPKLAAIDGLFESRRQLFGR